MIGQYFRTWAGLVAYELRDRDRLIIVRSGAAAATALLALALFPFYLAFLAFCWIFPWKGDV